MTEQEREQRIWELYALFAAKTGHEDSLNSAIKLVNYYISRMCLEVTP